MSTLSVPLAPEQEQFIKLMIKSGVAANKADVVRKALRLFQEEELLQRILRAEQEPTLKGDLRQLMKKFKK